MAANHAAATLIGLLLGQTLQDTVEMLGLLRGIPGCGQRLTSWGHATVVLESGGSPDRVATALRTHRSMKAAGRLWCIMAIDNESPTEHLAQIGSTMERLADSGIVTSTLASKQHFLAASHHVLVGVQHCASFRLVADRQRALEWAMTEAGPNDTIVLFLNERHQTAQQRRCDIDRITKSVEVIRQTQGDEPRDDSPIHLSIFG
jgi:UDP-N-acetylmuramoyl-L-alanyl-D-glutamate--2,6-diaminopimelate ligase